MGAILVKKDITFGGFGGEARGNLYRVNFELNSIHYINMPIIASELKGTNWHIIISATMFDGMAYEIDTVNKKLNVDTKDNQPIRILRLSDDNNNLSVYLAGTYETKDEYISLFNRGIAAERMNHFHPSTLISQEYVDQELGFSASDYENTEDIEFE